MGFFNKNKSTNKENATVSPTQEQMKNNKNGKLAYLWIVISSIVYILGFGMVVKAWEENIAIGIMALLIVLPITPLAQKKAISFAKEQRRINGKGRLALILATILPSLILAGGFFFFVFGGFYTLN